MLLVLLVELVIHLNLKISGLILVLFLISGCVSVVDFDECVAAGNPVMESYPKQCVHDGETFFEDISSEFCGSSSGSGCSVDSDCEPGGCSGQVCGGQGENLITTCEFRDCYDAEKYGVSCDCVENKCEWN